MSSRYWEEQRQKVLGFAEFSGVRESWHEPHEQGVDAKIIGQHFDNAMGTSIEGNELVVILTKDDGIPVAVNLCSLLADYCRLIRAQSKA